MANAKREHDYDVAIETIQYFGASFNGDGQRATFNRYRELDRIKTPEQVKEETRDAWDMMRRGLKFIANGRGG